VPVSLPETPFVVLPVLRSRFWAEVALWWPERRVLVCSDALGTVPHYFTLDGERLGVHERAAEALTEALAHSRRRLPRLLIELPAALRLR